MDAVGRAVFEVTPVIADCLVFDDRAYRAQTHDAKQIAPPAAAPMCGLFKDDLFDGVESDIQRVWLGPHCDGSSRVVQNKVSAAFNQPPESRAVRAAAQLMLHLERHLLAPGKARNGKRHNTSQTNRPRLHHVFLRPRRNETLLYN